MPPEFAKLDWLNLHIAHRPSTTNLRSTHSPPIHPSYSSPANDIEDPNGSTQLEKEQDSFTGCVELRDFLETGNATEEGLNSKTPKALNGARP